MVSGAWHSLLIRDEGILLVAGDKSGGSEKRFYKELIRKAGLRFTPRYAVVLLGLWLLLYCSFALLLPPLLDDADSVHAEAAREMLLRHDYITLTVDGVRYLEKAPLLYWLMAGFMRGCSAAPAHACMGHAPAARAGRARADVCAAAHGPRNVPVRPRGDFMPPSSRSPASASSSSRAF
jgi:hypothetical protein